MILRQIETDISSESERRKIISKMELTEKCAYCENECKPHSIKPKRLSTLIIVKWLGTGDFISCSKSCTSSLVNMEIAKNDPDSYIKRGKKSRETQLGRTLDEIHGKDKADELRSIMSKRASENNSRWSLKHRTPEEIEAQKELNRNNENCPFAYWTKGKTFEEIYGVERAKSIKEKIRLANIGENNPMYGKPDCTVRLLPN